MAEEKTVDDFTTGYARRALLPVGFRDTLAPHAEYEAQIIHRLMHCFYSYGYERVAPPLVEFEESLLDGVTASRAALCFRLMDPDTRRPMAVRCDMTGQVARLATTRLNNSALPMRLAYAGNILRTKASHVRPIRQFVQAGIELIGSDALSGEVETIAIAVAAFK